MFDCHLHSLFNAAERHPLSHLTSCALCMSSVHLSNVLSSQNAQTRIAHTITGVCL